MKDKINKICTELNDGKIAVVQAIEQLFDLYSVMHPLKTVKQGETLILDNRLEVEVITPESSVLIKDSRDGMLRWVDKERLKRK